MSLSEALLPRRRLLLATPLLALAGCGFELKRAAELHFDSIALTGFEPRSPLAQELRTQGVDGELVETALADCGDELARARQVWQRKFGDRPAPADAAGRAKQMRFLTSRGFSGETIRRVLRGDFEDD